MKFIVASGELQKALQTVSGVISGSQSRPILENFLFELENDNLKITASDGETTLITSIPVKSENNGRMAVPAKMFLDVIKSFGDQPLTFVEKESENGIGSLLEILDEKDNYFVALDNAEDYPELPEFDASKSVKIQAGILSEALVNTLFATSNDSLRPVMTGVLFQFNENEANFVSTDSHRLVVYNRKDVMNVDNIEFIMPKKPLAIIKNILSNTDDEVLIEFNENMAKFSFQDNIWICRLIDGKYPNYTAVIPKENPNVLTINRNLLLSSIRRASIFSNKSTNQVRFKLSGNLLHLHAEDTEYANKADMQIPCEYNGEDINIGFSSKFLTEMLSVLGSDDITMKMSQPNRPGIIEPVDGLEENESILMLSMPVIGL
ncbi:DNA polymerase III subunit beta [Elizabethkingia anophelis]|uniref:Beta sliding clamp n=4 Tax=Elizabethkingia anophelis TaxID=1117645 RepID=X5K7C5_9FLAO|nr:MULTISPECIES: DNA polymerase III subunit beta [Elizabethkingia]AIL45130.1 DNA polymerase III beta subunit [Elizabethkingia anophelis NUHP1]AKH93948.1 DNA polymerase III subunit beta [Elizabethkingia anophelis FMS-007]AMR40196.1 DNA polymerase III subunit beta [Elizabethkingia anophelis]AMX46829.1 DNA polymerase III subunit beta [Elizabethkingia anophelis]AMX50293.1 DNA polymerase III subunit beta [Elizabethkingia anophelis]